MSEAEDGAGVFRDHAGIIALGEPTGNHYLTQAEPDRCVILCHRPPRRWRMRAFYCPVCRGRAAVKDISDEEIEPRMGRLEYLRYMVGMGLKWGQKSQENTDENVVWIPVQRTVICKGEAFV